MNWYSNYKSEWKEIIETVSRELGKSEFVLEKDTVQSMFVYELSKYKLPFVFKGGTSLSKVYGLIDRFSEDVDLSMSTKPTESMKRNAKTCIIESAKKLDFILTNPTDIKSRYDYNRYVFHYDSLFSPSQMEIIIETNYYQTSYPVESKGVASIVGSFCQNRDIILPVPFIASSVTMPVQSLNRTFIDKIFAICDYWILGESDRESRHLYDIYKLIDFLVFDNDFNDLVRKVRADRLGLKNHPSADYKYDISKLLFDIIDSRFYEHDYENITKKLLFENLNYDYVIENGIKKVIKLDVFKN